MMKFLDMVGSVIVYGSILLFLWLLIGALMGGVFAVAARVYGALA